MMTPKTRLLYLIGTTLTVALTVSGCGSGGNGSNGSEVLDPQAVGEEILDTTDSSAVVDTTTNEMSSINETTEAMPTVAPTVSSAGMDDFIVNPLLSAVPAELNGSSTTSLPSNFASNPLTF